MQKFEAILFYGLLIIGLVGGLFWAVKTLDTGSEFLEKNAVLPPEEEELPIVADEPITAEAPTETSTPNETPSPEHAALIAELQKLIDDAVYMKVGSRGTRVGTVQKFLNVFEEKDMRVDNDYGAGTKTRVANFQKSVGISADGETGPATYQKMIDWLKAN